MANNVILRRFEVSGEYRPLSDRELVGTFDISTPPFNTGPVYLLGDDGSEVESIPGECHQLVRISLADIKVRGSPGDVVTIIGGTW